MEAIAKIILVEDDPDLGKALKQYLEISGFEVALFVNSSDLLSNSDILSRADLAILDVMLPDIDGFSLSQKISETAGIPFLFLTAKGQSIDRISGLKLGASDYISKPCDPEELILRIKNILKNKQVASGKEIKMGTYIFRPAEFSLISHSNNLTLTEKENDLLLLLLKNKGKLVSRKDILEILWGESNYFYGRSLDVFMSRLRKYFSDDGNIHFETVRGIGFKLEFD